VRNAAYKARWVRKKRRSEESDGTRVSSHRGQSSLIPLKSCYTIAKLYLRNLGGGHPLPFFLTLGGGIMANEFLATLQAWYLVGQLAAQYGLSDSVPILRCVERKYLSPNTGT